MENLIGVIIGASVALITVMVQGFISYHADKKKFERDEERKLTDLRREKYEEIYRLAERIRLAYMRNSLLFQRHIRRLENAELGFKFSYPANEVVGELELLICLDAPQLEEEFNKYVVVTKPYADTAEKAMSPTILSCPVIDLEKIAIDRSSVEVKVVRAIQEFNEKNIELIEQLSKEHTEGIEKIMLWVKKLKIKVADLASEERRSK